MGYGFKENEQRMNKYEMNPPPHLIISMSMMNGADSDHTSVLPCVHEAGKPPQKVRQPYQKNKAAKYR